MPVCLVDKRRAEASLQACRQLRLAGCTPVRCFCRTFSASCG